MLPKYNKIPSDSQINENDSLSPDLNNPNPNLDISEYINFNNQNKLNNLENNNSSLNSNINTEKELYNINNQSTPIISEGKIYYVDLPSENNSNNNIKYKCQDLFFNDINPLKNSIIQIKKKEILYFFIKGNYY